MGLRGHCRFPNCSGSRQLDLDKLIQLFGKDYVYIKDEEIGRRFVCTRCGRTGGEVTGHRKHDACRLVKVMPSDLARLSPAAGFGAK